jgi:hypothetical protein
MSSSSASQSLGKPSLVQPFLLIDGEWGTGKTHFLCDETHRRLQVMYQRTHGSMISASNTRRR